MFLLGLFMGILSTSTGFLFPTSGSGCCTPCPPPPVCPTQPMCAPTPTCAPVVAPIQDNCNTCSSCGGCKNKKVRVKRDLEEDIVKVDAKCNNNQLRDIIIKNIDRVTAVAKRRIQLAAESEMSGRYNVICARGDFSYITNTEVYCQQTVGDVTCYAFKQLSDVTKKT